MNLYFAKNLDNADFYVDTYDLTNKSSDDVMAYPLDESDWELLNERFVDEINQLCNTTLDYGDYDYFDYNKCKIIVEWISKNNLDKNSRLGELLSKIEEYAYMAIESKTGIAIDF